MAEEKKDQAPKQKTSVFKSLRAEFKKIIWPDRKTLAKETGAVLASAVFVGAVIALLDWLVQLALSFIM